MNRDNDKFKMMNKIIKDNNKANKLIKANNKVNNKSNKVKIID